MSIDFSIVIPAKNEADSLPYLLSDIRSIYDNIPIILVDDGSSDNTVQIATKYNCDVIKHPYSIGNGAAIKSGARAARTKYVLFMDADGQHDPKNISKLLAKAKDGYSMVVGARDDRSQANILRKFANGRTSSFPESE